MRVTATVVTATLLWSGVALASGAEDIVALPPDDRDIKSLRSEPQAPATKPRRPATELARKVVSAARSKCIASDRVPMDPTVEAPLHIGTQSYPQTLDLCDHEVVLTFDDGPAPETTPLILRALQEAGVHATFFLVGKHTREHPELAKQEFDEGHTVGHHSDTHPSFTLRGFDTDSAEADIENGIKEDEHAVYGDAATPNDPHVPFFRFPGFADTPALLSYLDRRRIAVLGSDLWAGDWIAMSADHERERVLSLLDQRPRHNGIILFHDTRRSTAEMLPTFLAELKARGYRVVQLVFAKGAPRPPLTAPLKGVPETERIIAHLRTPIVPGSHHLPGPGERANDAGSEPAAEGQP